MYYEGDRYGCLESNREVLSAVYKDGYAITHEEIVDKLNELFQLHSDVKLLSDNYLRLEQEANELREALYKIEKLEGCECDARKIARDAVTPF